MNKQLLLIFSFLLLGFSIVSAQEQTTAVKQISAGVVNGKALILSKPAYPAAARAVHAQGAVNVQVTIDEEGSVIAAAAVSGHPLLRQAAVEAARQSKFKPTMLSGQAVKVTGIIVYNFMAPERAISWTRIGFNLMSVQNAPSLMFLDTNSIDKMFAADWTTERDQLKRLGEIAQAEGAKINPPVVTGERVVGETTEKSDGGKTTVRRVVVERAIKSDGAPDAEQAAISQNLIASLQGRLGGDQLNAWRFNTGVALGQALSKMRFTNERQNVLDALRNQIQTAPNEISPEYIGNLQKVLTILENPKPSVEDRDQIALILPKLFEN